MLRSSDGSDVSLDLQSYVCFKIVFNTGTPEPMRSCQAPPTQQPSRSPAKERASPPNSPSEDFRKLASRRRQVITIFSFGSAGRALDSVSTGQGFKPRLLSTFSFFFPCFFCMGFTVVYDFFSFPFYSGRHTWYVFSFFTTVCSHPEDFLLCQSFLFFFQQSVVRASPAVVFFSSCFFCMGLISMTFFPLLFFPGRQLFKKMFFGTPSSPPWDFLLCPGSFFLMLYGSGYVCPRSFFGTYFYSYYRSAMRFIRALIVRTSVLYDLVFFNVRTSVLLSLIHI